MVPAWGGLHLPGAAGGVHGFLAALTSFIGRSAGWLA
jgi:hypothetical protein